MFDQSVHIVVVTRVTDADVWGWPLANPKCPVLQWPKFAWAILGEGTEPTVGNTVALQARP